MLYLIIGLLGDYGDVWEIRIGGDFALPVFFKRVFCQGGFCLDNVHGDVFRFPHNVLMR